MTASAGEAIFVETSARLHFGVLDLCGSEGRWFGGIGAAIAQPTLLVSARPHDSLQVEGDDAERAADFARRFLACRAARSHPGGGRGARVCVHRALPHHAGLGSGTQLALAVGRALAELHDVSIDDGSLAQTLGRGGRSGIGTWTFMGGGLVVEGGRRIASEAGGAVAPLLARLPIPSTWRCIVAVPQALPAISGAAEAAAFAELPPAPEREVHRVAYLVLMALLPALAEGDLGAFGASLSAIQVITGRWFTPVQGGPFAPGLGAELVRRMAEWGAPGVGQSSWGPAVYGIVDGELAAARLAERVRDFMSRSAAEGVVHAASFRGEGARVWRTRAGERAASR
jgi:beta-RFAP synthase